MTINSQLAINEADLKRVETEEEMARAQGFALPDPIYALGTPVNQVGEENYKASRLAFEKLPPLKRVLKEANEMIESEERRDVQLPLNALEMLDDGRLHMIGTPGDGAPMTKLAFEQLLYRTKMPRGAASYLSGCTPQARAWNVNLWLKQATAEVNVRTRMSGGLPQIFATLSSHRYHLYDAQKMIADLAQHVPTGARGELLYDRSRLQLTAHYHSDIQPTSVVAGELFRAAIIIDTADDGSRAIRIRAAITRNLCRNLILLHVAKKEDTLDHLDSALEEKVPALIKAACDRVKGFAERWTEASRERIAEKAEGVYDVAPVFEQLVDEGYVDIENVRDEEMVSRLLRAWQKEPGNTRAHVLNAITRAAHEETWGNPWVTSQLEEQAGQLLYNLQRW